MTLNPDGTVTYTPNPGYLGEDSFVYQVCDASIPTPVCDTATATISVTGSPPVANPDSEDVATGHFVVSLANVYAPGFRGDEPTAGHGLVSSLKRKLPETASTLNEAERHRSATLHHYGTLFQTDAPTTPAPQTITCRRGVIHLSLCPTAEYAEGACTLASRADVSGRRVLGESGL